MENLWRFSKFTKNRTKPKNKKTERNKSKWKNKRNDFFLTMKVFFSHKGIVVLDFSVAEQQSRESCLNIPIVSLTKFYWDSKHLRTLPRHAACYEEIIVPQKKKHFLFDVTMNIFFQESGGRWRRIDCLQQR